MKIIATLILLISCVVSGHAAFADSHRQGLNKVYVDALLQTDSFTSHRSKYVFAEVSPQSFSEKAASRIGSSIAESSVQTGSAKDKKVSANENVFEIIFVFGMNELSSVNNSDDVIATVYPMLLGGERSIIFPAEAYHSLNQNQFDAATDRSIGRVIEAINSITNPHNVDTVEIPDDATR